MKSYGVFLALLLIAGVFSAGISAADNGDRPFPPVDNQAYKQECSSCHYLYQPGLLPGASWEKLLKESGNHFGENLGLDEKTASEIGAYLTANSADKGVNEWAQKIHSSVGSSAPIRITETPYIQKKHRKIQADVFKRPAVQSFSNCAACHRTAAQGDFEEDNVSIPK